MLKPLGVGGGLKLGAGGGLKPLGMVLGMLLGAVEAAGGGCDSLDGAALGAGFAPGLPWSGVAVDAGSAFDPSFGLTPLGLVATGGAACVAAGSGVFAAAGGFDVVAAGGFDAVVPVVGTGGD